MFDPAVANAPASCAGTTPQELVPNRSAPIPFHGGIWADGPVGRYFLSIIRRCGARAPALLPGPIWASRKSGEPALSWFALQGKVFARDPLTLAVRALLESEKDLGTEPTLPDLMRRVVVARADLARVASSSCPAELEVPRKRRRVLLIDQRAAQPPERAAFGRMVALAGAEHPNADFWIWPAMGGTGYLHRVKDSLPNARAIAPGLSFFATLSHVDHVYTVSAPEGMQALLAGVPLRVFGRPYYAGWGLTQDELSMPERTCRPSLVALFDAVYLRLAFYVNLETGGVGTLSQLLDTIELQRAVRARFADCGQLAGLRFQIWKRHFATPFLTAGGGALRWLAVPDAIQAGDRVVLWGARSREGIPIGTPVLRMEDGFFHSNGLGSDMSPPYSQVLDRQGLYFDARIPNELTQILNDVEFGVMELARAAALRDLIVQNGVTKYNLGRRAPAWQMPTGKAVILVPGQVADDASIRFGTGELCTAEALLAEVRRRNPNGFIVYKPHPDVLSGNRIGLVQARELADIVDAEADLLSLVDCADEVHVLSSLAGFDALLRGKRVVTYGLPFYAGWGLTEDILKQPWRERALTLDMLVAGVLLRYPLYWDWRTRLFTTPEVVVRKLGHTASRPLVRIARDRGRKLRKVWRWSRNALRHLRWAMGRRGSV